MDPRLWARGAMARESVVRLGLKKDLFIEKKIHKDESGGRLCKAGVTVHAKLSGAMN